MPGLTFTVDTKPFIRNLVGQFRAMRDACFYAIDESADEFIDEMKKRIKSSPPGGREYYFRTSARRGESYMPLIWWKTEHGTYVTSKPGNPPRSLSGTLLESFSKRTFFSRGHTRIISYIDNTSGYALYLEYGGPTGGRWPWPRGYMEARPFMAPVLYDAEVNHRVLMRVRRVMESVGHAYGAR